MIYKITYVWGNHEGSILLWMLILTLFEAGCWRLLADQCDCDVQDGAGGQTALDLAQQHGHGAVEDLLRRMAIYYK
jgi:hypothetical protein